MHLSQLLAGYAHVDAANDVPVTSLALDSRAVAPGTAFFALKGGTAHGIAYAAEAARRGAAALVYEPPAETGALALPAFAVPALRAHLGAIANRFHGDLTRAMTVVGVTGTNGKTSTVQLLAQALAHAGHAVGTIGTLGAGLHGHVSAGERTTPDVLATHALIASMQGQGATHLAMEVSSHALDQGRVDGIAYDVAVFTNLTRDHLDYHGSMAAYGDAKARLFAWPGLSAAVINRDDAFGRELRAHTIAPLVLTFSAAGASDADLRARHLAISSAGIAFTLATPWGEARIDSPLLGRFNVENLLAVAGCLGALRWPLERIVPALHALRPIPGRMNRLGGSGALPLVVVDYAHTPDALEQALQNLRAHTTRRLICVFGCGGDRDAGKRAQMGAIAERLADVALITDDNPRSEDGDAIVAGIRSGFVELGRARVQRDRAAAIAQAIAEAGPGDTVLIAGKGHEAYQESGGRKLPFDDLDEARRALGVRT